MGILSSCPRVMTMQCWKFPIPPPLSTRLQINVVIICWGFVGKKKRNATQQNYPAKKSKASETRELHIFHKSAKFHEYLNDHPKPCKITQTSIKIHEQPKRAKSMRKRLKANVSSHNACHFGYPFFLSPSDDEAMLEIPNPTPSVHQTPGLFVCCWFFGFVLTKKKRNTT